MASIDEHKDRIERMKFLHDLNKHITTLATGTTLLMVGLFERVFKALVWKNLAATSFALFMATVFFLCSPSLALRCTPERLIEQVKIRSTLG